MRRFLLQIVAFSILLVSTACSVHSPSWVKSEPRLLNASMELNRLADEARAHSLTWDVTKRPLENRPWLGVDSELRLRLEQTKALVALPTLFDEQSRAVLDGMLELGRRNLLMGLQGLQDESPAAVEELLNVVAQRERAERDVLTTEKDRRAWIDAIEDALPDAEPHSGGLLRQLATLPAVPFVKAWIWNHARHEYRGPNWRDYQLRRVYSPDKSQDDATRAYLPLANEDELLAYYAPVVVQEIAPDYSPDFRDDYLGRAELIPDRHGHPIASIDTNHPTVYGYVSRAYMKGQWHNQLNYSFWYPDHPELKPNDPEAGNVEGQLIRITLDQRNRPLLSEAVYACGCYHRIYPLDPLENAARAEFGASPKGEFALAREVDGKIDPAIPETAGYYGERNNHPLVYVRAGFHLIAYVTFDEPVPTATERLMYELRPESEMETLPWGTETASFFDKDGLVRGADRPEAWMLYPSGMYHAGTPRIRGTHKIHFDQYDYDDPKLLEEMLKLPQEGGVLNDVASSPYSQPHDHKRMLGGLQH